MNDFTMFFLGVILGVFIGVFICGQLVEYDKDKCQESNNVYECAMKFVPVERE